MVTPKHTILEQGPLTMPDGTETGMLLVKERVQTTGEDAVEMEIAYTKTGHYVGLPEMAQYLFKEGIVPEPREDSPETRPGVKVCSIGFSEKHQKWFGWSSRALFGFGIGHRVEEGQVGYITDDPKKLANQMIKLLKQAGCEIIAANINEEKRVVVVLYDQQVPVYRNTVGKDGQIQHVKDGKPMGERKSWEHSFGRGEWTAETLEDCKVMAIDFAREIS